MADKELRRLKRRELLQMLLAQCEETERLQDELDETTKELETLQESYERLKKKLDIKDERLNQKDAKIAELKNTMEEMKVSRVIELEKAGSIAEASLRLNGIFEAAQRAAEQYLMNVKKISETESKKIKSPEILELTEEGLIPEQIEAPEKRTVSEKFKISDGRTAYGQKIPYESGWRTVSQRKRLHG